jgi:hypothetical protein
MEADLVVERSVVDVLRAARERISDPEHWTRSAFAKSPSGRPISPWSDGAVCWCARGSVYRECGSVSNAGLVEVFLMRATEEAKPPDDAEPIAWLNDNGTHDDVLALYDRAIELAEAEEV